MIASSVNQKWKHHILTIIDSTKPLPLINQKPINRIDFNMDEKELVRK